VFAQRADHGCGVLARDLDEEARSGKWELTPGKPLKTEQQQEIERLRRELAKAKTERDILKKAVAYFAKEP
jgi:transposase